LSGGLKKSPSAILTCRAGRFEFRHGELESPRGKVPLEAGERDMAAKPFNEWKEQQKENRRKQQQNQDSLASVRNHGMVSCEIDINLQLFGSCGV
jgi:hypothetical protein